MCKGSMKVHVIFEKRARFVHIAAFAHQIEDAFGHFQTLILMSSFTLEESRNSAVWPFDHFH